MLFSSTLIADAQLPHPPHRDDHPDAVLRLDHHLRPAAAAPRRPGDRARRRRPRPERRRVPPGQVPSRRAAADALPVLARRRGEGRSRRVAPHPEAGPRSDPRKAAGHRAARDDGIPHRDRDRDHRRHRLRGPEGQRLGLRRQRRRALGIVHAELLARDHADPRVLGLARLAAGVGLREPVRGPEGEPRGDDHAGVRARERDRRGAHAAHAQRDAASVECGLCAHGAGERAGRAGGRAQARVAQCAGSDHHPGGAGVRNAAVGRGADRAGVLDPGVREVDRRRGVQPGLPGGARGGAVYGDGLHHAQSAGGCGVLRGRIRG